MGVYSTTSSMLDHDIDNFVTECAHTPDMRGAYAIVAENEANYNAIMKAVGIAELAHYESTGEEMVYEAADVKGFFAKIKEFFMNIIAKIKALFKKFFALIDSYTMADKDFVSKYKASLLKVNTKDFEYKGFVFSHTGLPGSEGAQWSASSAKDAVDKIIESELGKADPDRAVNADIDEMDGIIEKYEDIEDIREKMRAKTLVGNSDQTLTSDEFSKEIYRYFRNTEDSKQIIDKVDVSGLLTLISNASTVKKTAERSYKEMESGLKETIKKLDNAEKALYRKVPTKEDGKTEEENKTQQEKYSKAIKAVSYISTAMKDEQSYLQMVNGGLLTAIKDQTRQAKAVCVALLNYKPKNESYDYGYEYDSYSEGGFLSGVVLK